jgi:hypothetical protein
MYELNTKQDVINFFNRFDFHYQKKDLDKILQLFQYREVDTSVEIICSLNQDINVMLKEVSDPYTPTNCRIFEENDELWYKLNY